MNSVLLRTSGFLGKKNINR